MINSRRNRWVGHAARMKKRTGLHRALVGKLEGKRPPGKCRRRWEENIRINLKKIGWGCGLDRNKGQGRWEENIRMNFKHVVPCIAIQCE